MHLERKEGRKEGRKGASDLIAMGETMHGRTEGGAGGGSCPPPQAKMIGAGQEEPQPGLPGASI